MISRFLAGPPVPLLLVTSQRPPRPPRLLRCRPEGGGPRRSAGDHKERRRTFVGDNGSIPSCEVGGSSRCPTCRPPPGPRLAPAGCRRRATSRNGGGWPTRPRAGSRARSLAETGLDPLAAARGWKPATVALYSKVARYGGIALPRGPRRNRIRRSLICGRSPRSAARTPSTCGAVAWCAIALGWPAPVALVPVAAPRPGARHRPPAADLHRRRRVGGARCADRLARLGGGPGTLPGARGQPVGAAGAAPRPGPGLTHRWPAVQPGAAGDLHQARRPDGAAPAGHRRALAAGGTRSWRWPTGSCPTTPTAGWRWPPARRRSSRARRRVAGRAGPLHGTARRDAELAMAARAHRAAPGAPGRPAGVVGRDRVGAAPAASRFGWDTLALRARPTPHPGHRGRQAAGRKPPSSSPGRRWRSGPSPRRAAAARLPVQPVPRQQRRDRGRARSGTRPARRPGGRRAARSAGRARGARRSARP